SLYNETNGKAILPTPAIGAVGLLADYTQAVGLAFPGNGLAVYVIGETQGHFGQSLYLSKIAGREDGAPPPVDLDRERQAGDFIRRQIGNGIITSCHDISDGGLLVAAAEMALAANIGLMIKAPGGALPDHAWAFGEDQARYLVTTEGDDFATAAENAGIPVAYIGRTGGAALVLDDEILTLDELRATHEGWLPDYMAG
ncbi:MAG: AIR synthase-related protein, partial [Rhodospirillales bacterium]|nr:AIR synthase-related protein [Rhodospirillales bacterium]